MTWKDYDIPMRVWYYDHNDAANKERAVAASLEHAKACPDQTQLLLPFMPTAEATDLMVAELRRKYFEVINARKAIEAALEISLDEYPEWWEQAAKAIADLKARLPLKDFHFVGNRLHVGCIKTCHECQTVIQENKRLIAAYNQSVAEKETESSWRDRPPLL